jgi:hypothetical protein
MKTINIINIIIVSLLIGCNQPYSRSPLDKINKIDSVMDISDSIRYDFKTAMEEALLYADSAIFFQDRGQTDSAGYFFQKAIKKRNDFEVFEARLQKELDIIDSIYHSK